MIEFQQTAAAIYLAAGIFSLLGLALPAPWLGLLGVRLLALGAGVQGIAFASLHRMSPVPDLSDLLYTVSFSAWAAVLSLLLLMWRLRLSGLTAAVGPLAFLAVFLPSLGGVPSTGSEAPLLEGAVPHAHTLLSSAGLGLLGIAGLAGVYYLAEHRRLKSRRRVGRRLALPSLEALDKVDTAALVAGFPLLTLGLITGSAWLHASSGSFWVWTPHAIWTLVGWGIYATMTFARFAGGQSARQAAASSVGGFVFLFFAVIGVELLK
jgi:ABC-type transport system involved in cytochrome c biogenesis permease subunit